MSADPLRCAVHDDVSTVVDGANKVATGTKGVVHHNRHTSFVGNFGNGLEVRNVVPRVANALDIYGLGLVIDLVG